MLIEKQSGHLCALDPDLLTHTLYQYLFVWVGQKRVVLHLQQLATSSS